MQAMNLCDYSACIKIHCNIYSLQYKHCNFFNCISQFCVLFLCFKTEIYMKKLCHCELAKKLKHYALVCSFIKKSNTNKQWFNLCSLYIEGKGTLTIYFFYSCIFLKKHNFNCLICYINKIYVFAKTLSTRSALCKYNCFITFLCRPQFSFSFLALP